MCAKALKNDSAQYSYLSGQKGSQTGSCVKIGVFTKPLRARFLMAEIALEILTVTLEDEMRQSYLDYAMSVIVGRALPDVRAGLKPVHRKILYAMYDSGFRPDRGYVKCARIDSDDKDNYHPHGDSSIYDARGRMG